MARRMYKSSIGKSHKWSNADKDAILSVIAGLPCQPDKVNFWSKGTRAGSFELIWKNEHRYSSIRLSRDPTTREGHIAQSKEVLRATFYRDGRFIINTRHGDSLRIYPGGTPELSINEPDVQYELLHNIPRIFAVHIHDVTSVRTIRKVAQAYNRYRDYLQKQEEIRITCLPGEWAVFYPKACQAITNARAGEDKANQTGRITAHIRQSSGPRYEVSLRGNGMYTTVKSEDLVTDDVVAAGNRIADWVAQGHQLEVSTFRNDLAEIMVLAYTEVINRAAQQTRK